MDSDTVDQFEADIRNHGEIHVVLEEHDAELEVRNGQYDPDHHAADALFTLWKHGQPHTFQYDRVVDWYEPHALWHDE